MKNMNWTAEQAMNALGIAESDRHPILKRSAIDNRLNQPEI